MVWNCNKIINKYLFYKTTYLWFHNCMKFGYPEILILFFFLFFYLLWFKIWCKVWSICLALALAFLVNKSQITDNSALPNRIINTVFTQKHVVKRLFAWLLSAHQCVTNFIWNLHRNLVLILKFFSFSFLTNDAMFFLTL